jgi:light-independent protochlorophyllide reductase subunit B
VYLPQHAEWVRGELQSKRERRTEVRDPAHDPRDPAHDPRTVGVLPDLLVTDRFQEVAARIAELRPDLVCGTQMERHACRKLDIPCMVIAPPTHIENHLLSYRPFLGFEGADVIADEVYTTATLGMEKHLIDLFGDAGLEYEQVEAQGERTEIRDPGPTSGDQGAGSSDSGSESNLESRIADFRPPLTANPGLPVWDAAAQSMLKKIPFFVRGRVQQRIERYASEHGVATITTDLVLEAKEAMGG